MVSAGPPQYVQPPVSLRRSSRTSMDLMVFSPDSNALRSFIAIAARWLRSCETRLSLSMTW